MMTIRRAARGDLFTVLGILPNTADWLRGSGYGQWPDGSPSLGGVRIGAQIDRGEFWLVSDDSDPVAIIAISNAGDTDFWTSAELVEPAVYLSKAAVVRRRANEGIGDLLLRWACDHAATEGAKWARVDVLKTNGNLQAYYRRQGWDYLRTVSAPGRNSSSLFQLPAAPDAEAQAAFTRWEPVAVSPHPGPIDRGTPVIVSTPDGPLAATVAEITADWSHGITKAGWEYGGGGPAAVYAVTRDGKTWTASLVWPDPAVQPRQGDHSG